MANKFKIYKEVSKYISPEDLDLYIVSLKDNDVFINNEASFQQMNDKQKDINVLSLLKPARQIRIEDRKIVKFVPSQSAKTIEPMKGKDITLRTFNPDIDFYIRDDSVREKYKPSTSEKRNVHWGQRKLLLAEIEFLTLYWDNIKYPKINIVYAGAAPGRHIPYLASLFEGTTWHLYDPRPFQIEPVKDKIILNNKLFLDEDAQYWRELGKKGEKCLFISDIRSSDFESTGEEELEKDVLNDMLMQMEWCKIIDPVKAHLKFRLPYPKPNMKTELNYLDGDVLVQCWAPKSSTETRLVPKDNKTMKVWDSYDYEDKMYHHNNTIRNTYEYMNPFTNNMSPIYKEEGLLNDYDSLCETYIIIKYLEKFENKDKVNAADVKEMIMNITNNLNKIGNTKRYLNVRILREQKVKSARGFTKK